MLKGYKTILANLVMLAPILFDILVSSEFRQLIPSVYLPYYSLGVLVVNMYLRTLTTTPVGKR